MLHKFVDHGFQLVSPSTIDNTKITAGIKFNVINWAYKYVFSILKGFIYDTAAYIVK